MAYGLGMNRIELNRNEWIGFENGKKPTDFAFERGFSTLKFWLADWMAVGGW